MATTGPDASLAFPYPHFVQGRVGPLGAGHLNEIYRRTQQSDFDEFNRRTATQDTPDQMSQRRENILPDWFPCEIGLSDNEYNRNNLPFDTALSWQARGLNEYDPQGTTEVAFWSSRSRRSQGIANDDRWAMLFTPPFGFMIATHHDGGDKRYAYVPAPQVIVVQITDNFGGSNNTTYDVESWDRAYRGLDMTPIDRCSAFNYLAKPVGSPCLLLLHRLWGTQALRKSLVAFECPVTASCPAIFSLTGGTVNLDTLVNI